MCVGSANWIQGIILILKRNHGGRWEGAYLGGCQGKWEEVAKVEDDQDTLSMFKNKNFKDTPQIFSDKLLSVEYFLCSVQPHPAKGRLIIHIFVEWVNEQMNKAYIMDYNEGAVVYI